VADCFDLRMCQSSASMPATADDSSAFRQNRADHRVRRGHTISSPRQTKCQPEKLQITFCKRFWLYFHFKCRVICPEQPTFILAHLRRPRVTVMAGSGHGVATENIR